MALGISRITACGSWPNAVATAFTLTAGVAIAQSSVIKEDQAQLRADKAAQSSEHMQLKADQKTLKADTKSGRIAAESKDAEKVYKGQEAIKGEKKHIAADKANLKTH